MRRQGHVVVDESHAPSASESSNVPAELSEVRHCRGRIGRTTGVEVFGRGFQRVDVVLDRLYFGLRFGACRGLQRCQVFLYVVDRSVAPLVPSTTRSTFFRLSTEGCNASRSAQTDAVVVVVAADEESSSSSSPPHDATRR